MECSKIMDMYYEYSGNDSRGNDSNSAGAISLLDQIQISLHTFFCQDCARKIELYESARIIMSHDFFRSAPELEDSIMKRITAEEEIHDTQEILISPGGFSTRSWVIAGLVLMVSLVTAFFGLEFNYLANESGMSFLLPMGITIGIVLTIYGALFIGSHLKELSERFGL